MPRTARAAVADEIYHVLNRGNARQRVFHDALDYEHFLNIVGEANARFRVEVFGACVMPNHFHFVVRPRTDEALASWMHWLTTTHVRRHHRRYGSTGHIWQGRFKAFPVQDDAHYLSVLRYVERNALRARLAPRAEDWRWSSAAWRRNARRSYLLADSPVPLPEDWQEQVNQPMNDAELEAVRTSVRRGSPYGSAQWKVATAKRLQLEFTLRSRGRPRKSSGCL